MVLVKGQLTSPEEFGAIVLRANTDGSTVRLRDVARIEVGGLSYQFTTRRNGQPSAGLSVLLAPTRQRARHRQRGEGEDGGAVEVLSGQHQVRHPLRHHAGGRGFDQEGPGHAGRGRGAGVPGDAAVPAERPLHAHPDHRRAGRAARHLRALLLFGLSINMLTLFGMVLAIGILVDDAIVVVENVERIMSEEGLPPKEATRKAMKQITGAIIGITLVLMSVFVPMAFFPGSVGIIYRQFSVSDHRRHRLLCVPGAVAHAGAVRDHAQAGRGGPPPRRSAACSAGSIAGWSRPRTGYGNVVHWSLLRTGRLMMIYAAMLIARRLGVLAIARRLSAG